MGVAQSLQISFYGDDVILPAHSNLSIAYTGGANAEDVSMFYNQVDESGMPALAEAMVQYREAHNLSDWMYYQLIRKTAQHLAPKADNYFRYTLYKWYLLAKSGYDAQLVNASGRLLMYVQSNDSIYNIPCYYRDAKQYVCLNIHDYNYTTGTTELIPIAKSMADDSRPFSYKVLQLPEFNNAGAEVKTLRFRYQQRNYAFELNVNPGLQQAFNNYPVVDYGTYFNIPLSKQNYRKLLPQLKSAVDPLSVMDGVDYLLQFTSQSLAYQRDEAVYGKDKRMGAEETLLSHSSDCDDRVALLYTLIKEIYDLPMIALVYADHIVLGVAFHKPVGKTVQYNGMKYSLCEATPQGAQLAVGEVMPALNKQPYQVVYSYQPVSRR